MSIYVRDAAGNRQKIAGVGLPGPAGKSAYQYAVEGGFSGTEEEFRAVVGVRSNPNLLDNWYLADPINQRGQTEYIGFVYTIDRWGTEGATIKVGDDGLQLENPSEGAVQFVTNFEASRLIDNQVYTASLLAKDLIGSGTMVIQYREGAFTYLLSAPLSDGLISVSGNLSTSGVNLLGYMIVLHPNSSVKLIAAKLELGPVQTLAHKEGDTWMLNDPPPNKALELAKCQRYYEKITYTGGLFRAHNNTDNNISVDFLDIIVPFETEKRVRPSVTYKYDIADGEEKIAGTAFTSTVNFTIHDPSGIIAPGLWFDLVEYEANADL